MNKGLLAFAMLIAIGACRSPAPAAEPARQRSAAAVPASSSSCALLPAVSQSTALRGYQDEAGSVPNEGNRAATRAMTTPIRSFLDLVGRAADAGRRATDPGCAVRNLNGWADARALLDPPQDFAGNRQLLRYAFGLNIAAAKLRAGGTALDPRTIAWLQEVTALAVGPFSRASDRRGVVNNLYVWSGATAASALLLAPNDSLRRYSDSVWSRSIGAIGGDGTITAELRRGSRALSYHAYYLSGLLWLDDLRAKLGSAPSSGDVQAIGRLTSRITNNVCQPNTPLPGSNASQIPPTPAAYRSMYHLESVGSQQRLQSCRLPQGTDYDPFLGGSVPVSMQVLGIARQPR